MEGRRNEYIAIGVLLFDRHGASFAELPTSALELLDERSRHVIHFQMNGLVSLLLRHICHCSDFSKS